MDKSATITLFNIQDVALNHTAIDANHAEIIQLDMRAYMVTK